MNLRVAWVLLLVVGCGSQPVVEEAQVATLEQGLTAAQARVFQSLLAAGLEAARARCLLGAVEVGAPSQPARSADSTLRLLATNDPGTWATRGCGPSVRAAREPNATSTSLRSELSTLSADGDALIQVATGLYRHASGDAPTLEFTSPEGRELGVDLNFDGYERAQVTVKVTRLALADAASEVNGLRPEDFDGLSAGQRSVAFLQLAQLVRSTSETARLADATASLLEAGPGQYVRRPHRCTALFLSYPCADFTWVGAQQTP